MDISFFIIGPVKEPAIPPPKTDDTDYDNELSCTHYCAMTDLTLVIIKGEGVDFQKFFKHIKKLYIQRLVSQNEHIIDGKYYKA